MKFICPDSLNGVCTETRCGRRLVNPREDGVDDNLQPTYTAACTFDGTLQYFHGLKPTRDNKQKAAEAEAAKSKGESEAKSTKRRAGVSVVMGREAHPAINVESGVAITVFTKDKKETRYRVRGAVQWDILNRFLSSIKNGENNDPGNFHIPFTSGDMNNCKGVFRTFVKTLIERQPLIHPDRHKTKEPFARFRVELLGNPATQARSGAIIDATAETKKK